MRYIFSTIKQWLGSSSFIKHQTGAPMRRSGFASILSILAAFHKWSYTKMDGLSLIPLDDLGVALF